MQASDWVKRGPGCPRRRFGHFFAVEKVTRVWAGEAREPSFEAVCFGRNRRGSSPKGAGAFSVHFCAYKSEPRGPGLGKPRKAEVWGRVGLMVAFPPARRKANQPFGGRGGPGKAGAPRPPAAKLEKFFSLCRNSPGFPRENPTLFFFERLKCVRIVLY